MAVNQTLDIVLPDRYEPVRHIATGGMASVWCAEDRTLGRQVAIKLLSDALSGDPLAERRFLREARAAARVSSHPHVATIYDVGEVEGRGFLVMEMLSGGSVADALRVGRVDRGTALRWLREAAEAIDHAHRHGVIHRDLKPANLLLDGDRVLHVADFGIARIASEAAITSTGQVFGSAGYVAPEQVLGLPATEAGDIWSLAATAFELLTGRRALDRSATTPLPAAGRVPLAPRASAVDPDLPAAVDPVLQRGMAEDPRDRWPSAISFVAALEEALAPVAEQPTALLAGPSPGRAGIRGARASAAAALPAPTRRTSSRMLAIGGLVALIVAVAALAASAGGGSPGSRTQRIDGTSTRSTASPGAAPVRGVQAAGAPAAGAPTATTPTTSTAPATAGVSGARGTASGNGDRLEARGHSLMVGGDYAAAIAVLQQAVRAAGPDSLTGAYALYDLGHSLRLSGNPQAAIPILQRRLRFPNQTDVVRRELALAIAAAGGPAASSGGAASPSASPGQGNGNGNGNGKHKHKHKGNGDGGGGGGD